MPKQSAIPLRAFFDAVERRLARVVPRWSGYKIEICGRIIELRFCAPDAAQNASKGLKKFIVETQSAPDAVFKYWIDDCTNYYAAEHLGARWSVFDASGSLANLAWEGFACGDSARKIFYYCHHSGAAHDPTLYAHAMHLCFNQWARSEGLLMLHGAVVGAEGSGLLIGGRGGAGKSTLSVSCLLAGMDFAADDYVILTGSGDLEAMPLYSSVCLNPDMAAWLKPDMPVLYERKNGKLELDASAYPFAQRIAVKGILYPAEGSADTPQIRAVPANSIVARIAHSSVQAFCGIPDPELIRAIASRLSGLPAYEFRRCDDHRKNADFLRRFIKGMEHHVQAE